MLVGAQYVCPPLYIPCSLALSRETTTPVPPTSDLSCSTIQTEILQRKSQSAYDMFKYEFGMIHSFVCTVNRNKRSTDLVFAPS